MPRRRRHKGGTEDDEGPPPPSYEETMAWEEAEKAAREKAEKNPCPYPDFIRRERKYDDISDEWYDVCIPNPCIDQQSGNGCGGSRKRKSKKHRKSKRKSNKRRKSMRRRL